jgi:diacylglycerol kinase family enzyme
MNLVAAAIDHPDTDSKAAIEPSRITVIFNPTAGRRRHGRLRASLHALAEMGLAATVIETRGPGEAERIARHAAAVDRSILVVAGGDGTINEAVNGLLSAQGPLPPLALIPLGTANVLAHEIGLGLDPAGIARTIGEAKRIRVRPGVVNGRHFLMMVGAGFDGAVVASVDPLWKRRVGRAAYIARTLVESFRYPFPMITGAVDGRSFESRWVVVCRGRHYGGPFIAAPNADLTAPRLTVCLLPGGGPWHVMRYGAALLTGRIAKLSDATVVTGTAVRIDGPAQLPVQGDGDLVARMPIEIGLAEREIELIVPG